MVEAGVIDEQTYGTFSLIDFTQNGVQGLGGTFDGESRFSSTRRRSSFNCCVAMARESPAPWVVSPSAVVNVSTFARTRVLCVHVLRVIAGARWRLHWIRNEENILRRSLPGWTSSPMSVMVPSKPTSTLSLRLMSPGALSVRLVKEIVCNPIGQEVTIVYRRIIDRRPLMNHHLNGIEAHRSQ